MNKMQTPNLNKLKHWFLETKRNLPWRKNPTPYAVWVSEVMLQQTQVSVVVPYFERWMKKFPTIADLACAEDDEVMKMWEGLGYYSRAKNLHKGAQTVLCHFKGKLPQESEKLQTIKGLGPYTIGAIQSFAFHKKTAAVDGNVIRVLTRYFSIESDISKPKTQQQLRDIAYKLLPNEEHWIINEALIELGATICQKKPKCTNCPIKKGCFAYLSNTQQKFPYKEKKTMIQILHRAVAVIHCKNHYLVHRVGKGKVMSDLYEFPYFEIDRPSIEEIAFLDKLFRMFSKTFFFDRWLAQQKHSFTRYRAHLIPALFKLDHQKPIEGYQWIALKDLEKKAFSSGHKRILDQLSRLHISQVCTNNIKNSKFPASSFSPFGVW